MQNKTVPPCPRCGLPEKCYKVSLLYLQGSAWVNNQKTGQLDQIETILREYLPVTASRAEQDKFITRLVKLIAPPAGGKRVLRQVHPDGMVGFFCLVSLVIFIRAFSDQPQAFPILVTLFVAAFTVYVIQRRSIVSRYNQRKAQERQEVITIEKAVSRWMSSYFCARDQGVFDPQTGQFASLDGLKEFFSVD